MSIKAPGCIKPRCTSKHSGQSGLMSAWNRRQAQLKFRTTCAKRATSPWTANQRQAHVYATITKHETQITGHSIKARPVQKVQAQGHCARHSLHIRLPGTYTDEHPYIDANRPRKRLVTHSAHIPGLDLTLYLVSVASPGPFPGRQPSAQTSCPEETEPDRV